MKIITNLEDMGKITKPLALALGNFDGVHRGHQYLIGSCVAESAANNLIPGVLTFEPHPGLVLGKKEFKLLNTGMQKYRLIEKLGAEYLFLLPFNGSFADTTPESFVTEYLVKLFRVRKVYVGFNYSFGHKGMGNPALLQSMGKTLGFAVKVIEPVVIDGEIVSSTLVRQKYCQGDLRSARKLLGYWPQIEGKVVPGSKRGRILGFPTANISVSEDILLPAEGVYAAFAEYQGRLYQGVVNIGCKPTFNDPGNSVEIHIFDFREEIYGEVLRVHLIERIRPVLKFTDGNQLKIQIEKDSQKARDILAGIKQV